jgi:malonate decarboxylase holo-[acyl-carrier-protein] synthase/biotin-independent malonate decarboxylase gamma subunit
MTLDEMLNSLFPQGHAVQRGAFNTLRGRGQSAAGDVAIIGISDGVPVGIDNTLILAGHVLSIIETGGNTPIVVLIDAAIQNMTRRDELLGLPEYFGHLYKTLALAGLRGHRTIAVLYGPAAGGSLIAAALAVQSLVTVPGGEPSVMDLPSIARVTKLPLGKLQQMAKATPIFAPGIDNYFLTGSASLRRRPVPEITPAGPHEGPWSRHELLRIAPLFWRAALPSRLDRAAMSLLDGWADRGWPVIVRRRMVDERSDHAPVGVPLPPALGKQRIALCVPANAVLERSSPPALCTVQREGDPSWQATIDALITLGARLAVMPASYGSLLWQHQTGLRYLSRQSDIDVLWYAHRECDVPCLIAGIAAIQRTAPMRIDGEVVFANGDAVNWRELHACLDGKEPAEVLVKSIDGVRLVNVSWLQDLQRAA